MENMEKVDFSEAVIEVEYRCIDRGIKLGRQFDMMSEYADHLPDANERRMIKDYLAYTEACIVIGRLCPGEDGKRKIEQLRAQMAR